MDSFTPAGHTSVLLVAAMVLAGEGSSTSQPDPAVAPASDARLIARGAQLAAVGSCHGCHTRQGGEPYAGGFPMHSPFGTIYTTNITPDRETGIGAWSVEDFARALREGIGKDGEHLYPAFPYDRFQRTTDEDVAALYAFVMSLPPVRVETPANTLVFPFNVRAGLALWKQLHLKPAQRGPATPGALGRGEYLAEGLGHCGSCHSPRTRLFGEDLERVYEGGEAEGWHAYAIDENNRAPIPWDAQSLAFYLRHGWHPQHGIARGTMGLVTDDLAAAAPEDIEAMAQYVASLMKPPAPARTARARELLREPPIEVADNGNPGAAIYDTTCLDCHRGGDLPWDGLPLAWSIGLAGESPRNLVNVILHGLPPVPGGETAPMMPGYAGALDDEQVESLVRWVRANLTDQPPWTDVRKTIAESRQMTPSMLMFPPGGIRFDPAKAAP